MASKLLFLGTGGTMGGGEVWSPTDLGASLLYWFDRTALPGSGTVETMTDSSGNGNHFTQSTESLRAVVAAAHWADGTNALTFDDSDDYYTISTSAFSLTTFTLAFLIDIAADGVIVAQGTGSYIWNNGSRSLVLNTNPGSITLAANGSVPLAPAVLVIRRASDDTTSVRIDGVEVGTGNSDSDSFSLETISWNVASNELGGEVGDVIVCDSEITGSDLTNMEEYLAVGVS